MPWKRTPRLCACGCGRPLRELYSGGRFKGYSGVYAPECPHARGQGIPRPERAIAPEKQHTWVPIGTRSRKGVGQGAGLKEYWKIKVGDPNRWQYEHRLVMEHVLGRPLTRHERIYHRNGDGLDNRPENLELVNDAEHGRRTGPTRECAWCGQQFYAGPAATRRCCSPRHAWALRSAARQKANGEAGRYGSYRDARRTALSRYTACQDCGWGLEPAVLELHHVDRDRTNQAHTNVRVLCPTCHTLEHYRSKDGQFANNLGRAGSD